MIDDCIGKLLGIQHARGIDIPLDAVEEIGPVGAKYMTQQDNAIKSSALQNAPDTPRKASDESVLKKLFVGDLFETARGIVYSMRNPSGIFGEDIVRPVNEFITAHYQDYADDLVGGRDVYQEGIEELFAGIDTSRMSLGQQTAFDGYKKFYLDGGELYALESRNWLDKAFQNLTGNTIKSSPTVVLGNVFEGATKLPTLYPKTFIPAIAKAMEQGLVKKIPELAEQGVYGLHYAGEKGGMWEGLIGATDIPLKNISYYAAQLAGEPGTFGVQKIAFTPRFGDLPSVYYTGSGRAAVSLLGYTINSYKMYAGLWQSAKQGNWQPVLTYHLLAGLIGGAGAVLPKPIEEAIKLANPDSEEWFEENRTPLARITQPGNITRLGVSYDIAKSQTQKAGKNFGQGVERLSEGDASGGFDLAMGAMNILSFTNAAAGDVNAQKAVQLGIDYARQDDEAVENDIERLSPFK